MARYESSIEALKQLLHLGTHDGKASDKNTNATHCYITNASKDVADGKDGTEYYSPGLGSSPFGICITQFVDSNEVQILYADEFEGPDYNVMLSKCSQVSILVMMEFSVW